MNHDDLNNLIRHATDHGATIKVSVHPRNDAEAEHLIALFTEAVGEGEPVTVDPDNGYDRPTSWVWWWDVPLFQAVIFRREGEGTARPDAGPNPTLPVKPEVGVATTPSTIGASILDPAPRVWGDDAGW